MKDLLLRFTLSNYRFLIRQVRDYKHFYESFLKLFFILNNKELKNIGYKKAYDIGKLIYISLVFLRSTSPSNKINKVLNTIIERMRIEAAG